MRDLNYPNDNCDTLTCKSGIEKAFYTSKQIENRTRNIEVTKMQVKMQKERAKFK